MHQRAQIYESPSGWPPVGAQHFRDEKCGRHIHIVCPWGAGGCTHHVDEHNPDCDGELADHLQHDFWPAYRKPILVGLAVLASIVILRAL